MALRVYRAERTLLERVEELVIASPGEWTPGGLSKYLGVPIHQVLQVLRENPWLKERVKFKYKEELK